MFKSTTLGKVMENESCEKLVTQGLLPITLKVVQLHIRNFATFPTIVKLGESNKF